MSEAFVEMLRGATNTLGRTEEVVELVFIEPQRAQEVYDLFHQDDEWVRLRAASVSKRIWRAQPDLFAPFIDGWIEHVSQIDQPSSQWTFAQMCDERDASLTDEQRNRSIEILCGYLMRADDWIVLNSSMPPLARWAHTRPALAASIRPRLEALVHDERRSVARRATTSLGQLPS